MWDEDGETAVQSPQGGTTIAWGGPPVPPVGPREPQHFELVVDGDPAAEVDRLVGLGAAPQAAGSDIAAGGGVVLLDPDGLAFRVVPDVRAVPQGAP